MKTREEIEQEFINRTGLTITTPAAFGVTQNASRCWSHGWVSPMVAAILEGGRVTIDVARLRELHQPMYGHTGDPCSWCREWTPCPVTELLDAYEERERLRAALEEQGFLQKNADGSTRWHIHDCPASFDFAQCNYRCRVARAALEGRE